jgi:hypothetical protein
VKVNVPLAKRAVSNIQEIDRNFIMMRHKLPIIVLMLAGTPFAGNGHAQDERAIRPLATHNDNPLVRIFNIPGQAVSDTLLSGKTSITVSADVTSHFTGAVNSSERINIDGETHRITLRAVRGLSDHFETGVEISLLKHTGGFLDGLVNNWHDIFNFPRLGRDKVEDNLLNIHYLRKDEALIDLTQSSTGVGDLILFFGKGLLKESDEPKHAWLTLRGQVGIPTGDPEQLYGSGGANLALWLQASRFLGKGWSVYGSAGISYLGSGEVLPDLQRHWVLFAGGGMGWQLFDWMSLKLQIDTQTSAYKETELTQLGRTATQLSFGTTIGLSKQLELDIAVVENIINSAASPDLGLSVAVRSVF